MTRTVLARFDGEVLRFEEPVELAPDTVVRVLVPENGGEHAEPRSFLDVVQSLNLDGPRDASTRLDEYLYGDASRGRSPLP